MRLLHWFVPSFIVPFFSSTIIHHLCGEVKKPHTGVCYFYCDFRDPEKQKSKTLVCSLISQLCCSLGEIPSSLKSAYAKYDRSSQPTFQDLIAAFEGLLEDFLQVYVVLDALDECSSSEWPQISKFLVAITGDECKNLHFLCTSRQEQYVEQTLKSLDITRMYLHGQNVDKDIVSYVRQIVKERDCFKRWGEARTEAIILQLAEKAHGM